MFKVDERIFETSLTTGTGTYTLEGGVVTFAGLDGNDLVGQVTPDGLVFDLGTLTPR